MRFFPKVLHRAVAVLSAFISVALICLYFWALNRAIDLLLDAVW